MKLTRILFFCAGLFTFGTVTAKNLTLLDTPTCALTCLSKVLSTAPVGLPLPETLCKNITMQSTLSTCVQTFCKFSDQIIASEVQMGLCAGYPTESNSNDIIILIAVFSIITFPIAGLKFYTRWSMNKAFDWDDYAALAATVFMAGLAALQMASAKLGLGQHYWTVDAANGVLILKFYYVTQMFYVLIQVTAKISLLLLYIRVFPRTRTAVLSKIGIAFLGSHGIIYLFLVIFQCKPIRMIWDKNLTGKCISLNALGFSGAGASIVEDFFILILPIWEIRNLQLGRGKKWNLFLVFSIGSFACVTSIVRLKFLTDLENSFDSTWDQTDIIKWSIIEEFIAVICACIPSLRALIVQTFKSLNSSVRSVTKSKNSSNALSSNNTSGLRAGAQRLDDDDNNNGAYPMYAVTKTIAVESREKRDDEESLRRHGSTTAIFAGRQGNNVTNNCTRGPLRR